MWTLRFSQEHVKVSRYFLNNFVTQGPNHPPSPFSFAVLERERDYGGQVNAQASLGLRRGRQIALKHNFRKVVSVFL